MTLLFVLLFERDIVFFAVRQHDHDAPAGFFLQHVVGRFPLRIFALHFELLVAVFRFQIQLRRFLGRIGRLLIREQAINRELPRLVVVNHFDVMVVAIAEPV